MDWAVVKELFYINYYRLQISIARTATNHDAVFSGHNLHLLSLVVPPLEVFRTEIELNGF